MARNEAGAGFRLEDGGKRTVDDELDADDEDQRKPMMRTSRRWWPSLSIQGAP